MSASAGSAGKKAKFDWREVRRRRRARVDWESLVASGIVHMAVFLTLSVSILTIDVSEISALLVDLSAEPEEVSLESLSSGAGLDDAMRVETASFVSVDAEDPFAEAASDDLGLADLELARLPTDLALPDGAPTMEPVPKPKGRSSVAAAEAGDEGKEQGPPKAEYFGTVAEGDRFVYVVDMSGSMGTPSGGQSETRFHRAVDELFRSLDQLQPDQSFYVVFFADDARRMFDDDPDAAEMLPATAENRQRLRKWVDTVGPGGGTQPRGAIRFAMSLRPSAVFLLSDGQFNGFSSTDRREVFHADPEAAKLLGAGGTEQVPIHSFAFEDPQSQGNMRSLAALTGGRYRFIAPAAAAPAAPPAPPVAVPQPQPTPPPPTPVPTTPAGLLAAADQLRDSGQYAQAMRYYQELVQFYPMTSAGATARGRLIQLSRRMRY